MCGSLSAKLLCSIAALSLLPSAAIAQVQIDQTFVPRGPSPIVTDQNFKPRGLSPIVGPTATECALPSCSPWACPCLHLAAAGMADARPLFGQGTNDERQRFPLLT